MSNLINRWRALWNPDMYHGWGKQTRYFEGWYFKIVDPTEQYAFAIIPGISIEEDGQSHAFIQLLDGKKCTADYLPYKAEEFVPATDRFDTQLANNRFSANQISLDLPKLKGTLQFTETRPWPKSLGAPGIMGWFSFVPFMQCYHGVVSVHHYLNGTLEVEGKTVDFTGGKGYIEKDWGRSFPSSWIWIQTNHFGEKEEVSLMASVARIPWIGSNFIGYIVGFWWEGKLYKFATYTGAKMKATLGEDQVFLSFKDRTYRLEIVADKAAGGDLISPISGKMTGKVNESMQAEVHVQFYKKDELLWEGKGRNAGMEVAGPVKELLTDKWRR